MDAHIHFYSHSKYFAGRIRIENTGGSNTIHNNLVFRDIAPLWAVLEHSISSCNVPYLLHYQQIDLIKVALLFKACGNLIHHTS